VPTLVVQHADDPFIPPEWGKDVADRILGAKYVELPGRNTYHFVDPDWHALLDAHDAIVRAQLVRFRGREVNTSGDGFLAMFDGPQRAIRCAMAIRDAVQALGIEVRAGLHTGECEVRGEDIGGIAVHIGARVSALAGPNEVLVPARCATW
jgi:class 3 adenylate cyclase